MVVDTNPWVSGLSLAEVSDGALYERRGYQFEALVRLHVYLAHYLQLTTWLGQWL